MKALTPSKEWYFFTLKDIPVLVASKAFVLLSIKGSPILDLSSIRRGDESSGLFEGDIISCDGEEWLVCYERGFYAINKEYTTKYLYQLKDAKVIGDYFTDGFPVAMNLRTRYLFKYQDAIFRLEDIVGGEKDEGIIIRSCNHVIKFNDVKQECCMSFDGQRVFFGDVFPEGTIKLHGGRVCFEIEGHYVDLTNGGEINGCTA